MAEIKEKKYVSDDARLIEDWDWEKNNKDGFFTEKVRLGNNKYKIHWKCKYGHQWQAVVYSRSSLKTNCPYCSGRYATPTTSLLATNPELAKQWDYSKNGNITPDMVKKFSHYPAWWLCEKGHSWRANVSDRSNGNGCPICMNESHSSFPEQALFYYVKRAVPSALNRHKYNNRFEADVYLPEYCIAIEYDGEYFHNENGNDLRKENYFRDNNIVLIRIKEGAVTIVDDNKIVFGVKSNPSGNDLSTAFRKLFAYLKEKILFCLMKT